MQKKTWRGTLHSSVRFLHSPFSILHFPLMFLGLEIGGTKLQLVLGDDAGKICERRKLPVDAAGGAAGIRQQIERALPELLSGRQILRAGVGFGGPVDWKAGRICRSHQIEGWSEFDLGGWLRKVAGAPVVVDNDANVAALGEAMHGAGVGCNPVFYVTLGSGVGGGLVVDGRIYHGAKPGEAEIGHVRLDRQGTIVEARCSGWAVDARIRELRVREPEGVLARLTGGMVGGEAKHLAAAWRQGDAAARRLLQETAEDLAFGLSHVVHLFHPEIIVLGGGLSGVGEPLRASVESALRPFTMEAFAPGPRIALAGLGEDAVPVGALELARLFG
jgi:glucokinase